MLFKKTEYKTFNDFKFTFIEGNVSGKESLFDLNFVSKGKNLAKNIENGVRCKLMFERNNAFWWGLCPRKTDGKIL